jgi:hypothetical protein
MEIANWTIVISAAVTALATVAIAINAIITYQVMKKTERERNDLYMAMVVSNLLCSPLGDNPRLYDFAKSKFDEDYRGQTPIFKEKANSK